MLHAILDQISESEKPIIKIIFRNDDTRVVAFGLKKGLKLIDHQLPVNAKILMLKGEIEIDSKIEIVNLKEFDEYITKNLGDIKLIKTDNLKQIDFMTWRISLSRY